MSEVVPSLYYGDRSQGVETFSMPQDTDPAAAQALEEQKPGDEFNPKPNPNIAAMLKRINELDKQASAICDKMWMRPPGRAPLTYEEREDLEEELRGVDRERNGIRAELHKIYDPSPNDTDPDAPEPLNKQPAPTVIGADGARN